MRFPALGLADKSFLQMYLANPNPGAGIRVGKETQLPMLANPPDSVDFFFFFWVFKITSVAAFQWPSAEQCLSSEDS